MTTCSCDTISCCNRWAYSVFAVKQILRNKEFLLLWDPKNQSVGNNSVKPQPIRTKFGTCAGKWGQLSGNFRRDRPSGAKWEARSFLSGIPHDCSATPIATADCHLLWLRRVNPCPVEYVRKEFSQIFCLGSLPSKTSKLKGSNWYRILTRNKQSTGHTEEICRSLHVVSRDRGFPAYSPGVTLRNASGYSVW